MSFNLWTFWLRRLPPKEGKIALFAPRLEIYQITPVVPSSYDGGTTKAIFFDKILPKHALLPP